MSGALSDGFRAVVTRSRTAARAQGLAVEAATRRVVELLADRGIAALPLKGPFLAAAVHGDIGLRETADVDILVAAEQLDAAARALVAVGFTPPVEHRRHDGLPDLHFILRHPTLPEVELHWRLHWYERSFAGDMLARARPADDGLLRADPRDLAASLLLFYARDGFHGMRMAADIAAWSDSHRARLEPAFLAGHARSYPELAPALTSGAIAAERLTGVPALEWLGDAAASGRRIELAVRMADWRQDHDRDQMAATISLIGGLLGPRGSARDFARRELRTPSNAPTATAAHAIKMCSRYTLALWRVRGTRTWAADPVVTRY
jgi:hypothetical protein